MKLNVENLTEAYEELIDVLGLVDKKKNPIEVPEDADVDFLEEKIKEAMTLVDPKVDTFEDSTQKILDALAEEDEEEEEEEEEPAPKKKAGKKKGPIKKAGEPGKPGIIATIVSMIEDSGKKGISKDDILAELIELFPDRNEQSMKNTINVQVPARINKEKFPIEKLEGGLYRKKTK